MDMIAQVLQIPSTVRLMGTLKGGMNLFTGNKPFASYEPNVFTTNVFGKKQYNSMSEYSQNFVQRVKNIATTFFFEGLVPVIWSTVFYHVLP